MLSLRTLGLPRTSGSYVLGSSGKFDNGPPLTKALIDILQLFRHNGVPQGYKGATFHRYAYTTYYDFVKLPAIAK